MAEFQFNSKKEGGVYAVKATFLLPFLNSRISQKCTFSEKIIDIYSGAGQMRRIRTTNAESMSAESSAKRDIDAGNRPDHRQQI